MQTAQQKGAQLHMTWPSSYGGTGLMALTALVDPDGDGNDVLVVAFRGTSEVAEWMEYRAYFGENFRPLYGEKDPVVWSVWMDTMDNVGSLVLAPDVLVVPYRSQSKLTRQTYTPRYNKIFRFGQKVHLPYDKHPRICSEP